MDQNTNASSKKNGCLKFTLIACCSLFCLFLLIGLISYLSADRDKKNSLKKSELLKNDSLRRAISFRDGWDKAPDSLKEKEINNFIISDDKFYSDKRFLLNESLLELIKLSAKYPETVEYVAIDGEFTKNPHGYTILKKEDFSNVNYKKGLFTVSKDFKSENKLGMKVRGRVNAVVSFNGIKYTIKDISFE